MKRYALLLACLAWTLGTSVYGQGAGGGGGGAGGGAAGGAAGGAVGGATAGTGTAVGGTVGGVGNSTIRTPTQPLTPVPPLGGAVPGGVGTPGQPATGTGGGIGTGATGGVEPGVGATGGVGAGVGGTGGTLAPETGITGSRGPAGAGAVIPMTPADTALTQQIRSQLLTPGNAGGVNTGVANSTVTSGTLTPQDLANVQITSNNGVIVLRGRVTSEAQRQLLENRVRHMNGVRSVIDGLVIAGPGATSGAVGTTTPGGSTIPGPTP